MFIHTTQINCTGSAFGCTIPANERKLKTMKLLLIGWCLLGATVLASGAEKRELLARQETVAEFQGLHYQQCRGLTTLCPDKCGSSGNFARFRIVKYLVYEKPGQYGDPKQEEFIVQVDDNLGQLKLPAQQVGIIRGLKPGDFVRLAWRHDYVTNNGGSYPERPLTAIEKLTPEAAKKLVGDTPLKSDKPDNKPGFMPIQPL
jgi:hypothetical protein